MEEEIIDIDLPPEDQLMAEEPPDPSSMRDREPEVKEVPRDGGRSRQVPRSLDKTSRSAASRSSERSRDHQGRSHRRSPDHRKERGVNPHYTPTPINRPRVTPGHPAKEPRRDYRESRRDTQQTLKPRYEAKNGPKKPYNHTRPLYIFSSEDEELDDEVYLSNEGKKERDQRKKELPRTETRHRKPQEPKKDLEDSKKNHTIRNGGQRNQEPEKDLGTSRRPEKEANRELPQEVEDVSLIPEPESRIAPASGSTPELPEQTRINRILARENISLTEQLIETKAQLLKTMKEKEILENFRSRGPHPAASKKEHLAEKRKRQRRRKKAKQQEDRLSMRQEILKAAQENSKPVTVSVSSLVDRMDISDAPVTVNQTPVAQSTNNKKTDEFDAFDVNEDDIATCVNPLLLCRTKKGKEPKYRVQMPPAPGSSPNPPKTDDEPPSTVIEFTAPETRLGIPAIRDQWLLLEREYMLSDIFRDNPTQNMPPTSVAEVARQLKGSRFLGKSQTGFFEIIDKMPDVFPDAISCFINTVECTRILSVNTEGTGFRIKENNIDKPRVMITLGAADGRVLFFNRYDIVPPKIIQFLQDPRYTKIGSGLEKEMSELDQKDVQIQIRNWVEIGCLRMSLFPPAWTDHLEAVRAYQRNGNFDRHDIPCGIESMIDDLKKAGHVPYNYKRTDYDWKWEKKPQTGEAFVKHGRIPPPMMPHLLENARIPFAELILIVETFAKRRKYDLTKEPFWPIAYEALDLCRFRDPRVFQHSIETDFTRDFWVANLTLETERVRSHLPAMCEEMNFFFRARVDFREPYFRINLEKAAQGVYNRFFPEDQTKIAFVTNREIQVSSVEDLVRARCSSCGDKKHHFSACPVNKKPVCRYPHDGQIYSAHSTLCCPHLHKYCKKCHLLGHDESIHWNPMTMLTCRELRKRFAEFMPEGLLTSIPLLVLHPDGKSKLKGPHWKLTMDSRRFHQAVIGRFALGITTYQPDNTMAIQRTENDMFQARLQKDYQLEVIRANIKKRERDHYAMPKVMTKRFDFQKANKKADSWEYVLTLDEVEEDYQQQRAGTPTKRQPEVHAELDEYSKRLKLEQDHRARALQSQARHNSNKNSRPKDDGWKKL